MTKKILMNIICVVIGAVLVGVGGSLCIKAAIGVSAFDAFNGGISELTSIKIGTVSILVNVVLVLVQWAIQKRQFRLFQLLQIPLSLLIGKIFNVIFYTILPSLILEEYYMNVALLVLGNLIAALGVGLCTALDFVSFPLESLCMVISKRSKASFGKIRQSADIILIIASVTLTLLFSESLFIREGTIIGALLFAPMMNFIYLNIYRIFPIHHIKLTRVTEEII
ncbi:hypothetical protein JTF06_13610 [Desemzia sp. RIT804]|uniref:YczE/YyaS/YitT family protein n=1 Tax=Desemzia sp. RIT 804 TaxID=2810209 RepID=UPI001952531D|nr:hypothetical protein [Desemzia sp. RIT 804]MBM6615923.1 hypothetical protein [Desemzia sp. RIT 804]